MLRTVDFGPRRSGIATVGYRLGGGTRRTLGVSELLAGAGIYGVAVADADGPAWILWDTGEAAPRYAVEDLDVPGSVAVHRSADFGPRHSGLASVGYTLDGLARSTFGVSELLAGTGIYGALIAPPAGYEGPVTWDTGGPAPRHAVDSIGPGTVAPAPAPAPTVRDRTILRLIADALAATGEFDEVCTTGLPERTGRTAGDARLASLELVSFKERELATDPDTAPRERTVRYHCYLLVRVEDPDARDDEVDRLANVAANAVDGQTFAGITLRSFTTLDAGQYLPAAAPERRLVMTGQFVYLLDSYATRSVT